MLRKITVALLLSLLLTPYAPAQSGVTNYYVATTGNDANTCLSIATPCLTLQAAWNKIAVANYGIGGAQLNIVDGTYTDALVINGTWAGAGPLSIVGNCSTPGNVILSPSGTSNITVTNAFVSISCLELRNISGGFAELRALSGSDVTISNIRFGTTDGDMMQADGGKIRAPNTVYSIVGNMGSHGHSFGHGLIEISNTVVTLIGTPAIGNFFFGVNDATINFTSSSFVGTGATGLRFLVHFKGRFNTNGAASLTYLPGTVNGILGPDGSYDFFFVGNTP